MSHALSGQQDPRVPPVLDQVYCLTEAQWQQARSALRFDYIVAGGGSCALAFAERMLRQRPHAAILLLDGGAAPGAVRAGDGASVWCPRPTSDEMAHWPPQTILAAQANFASAEQLLNVVRADCILAPRGAPAYGALQEGLQEMLADNLGQVESATRSMAAPLALTRPAHGLANRRANGLADGLEFDLEFRLTHSLAPCSAPAPLQALVRQQQALAQQGRGTPLRIATGCAVRRLHRLDGKVTALDTGRGRLEVGDAQVILAMDAVPAAALLMDAFPEQEQIGQRYTGHFISTLTARAPRAAYPFAATLGELEMAALYLAGKNKQSGMQYHVQLTALSDRAPERNAARALRHLPDALASIGPAQLASSAEHVVFACAVLGELDYRNGENRLRRDGTPEVQPNAADRATWDTMDEAAFQLLELALAGGAAVEYWHEEEQAWDPTRPAEAQRRRPGLVHEGSALWIGEQQEGPVGLDYRPHGVDNVYITGGALWPAAGSWNPELAMVALSQDLADGFLRGAAQHCV
ncbi:GMC family oxidoreductase [Pseudoduganella sp. LjRoot289]|uniref:GMC oxidoreductase n=1 Tax=Pseudoduganella sp. LjRoot289 TaxID=3342314 RepID=UPI003ECE53A6